MLLVLLLLDNLAKYGLLKETCGAREMVQWLRVLVVLAKDVGQFPAHTWWLSTICNYSSGEPTPPSDFPGHPAHTVHMSAGKIFIHVKSNL